MNTQIWWSFIEPLGVHRFYVDWTFHTKKSRHWPVLRKLIRFKKEKLIKHIKQFFWAWGSYSPPPPQLSSQRPDISCPYTSGTNRPPLKIVVSSIQMKERKMLWYFSLADSQSDKLQKKLSGENITLPDRVVIGYKANAGIFSPLPCDNRNSQNWR